MADITFEEFREENLQDIIELYNWYVHNSTATWHYHALSEAEMRDLVLPENSRYGAFVIKTDGVLCGYVSVRQYKSREAYGDTAEVSIYLREDYNGKGIGNLALRHIEEFSRQKGFHVLVASISGDNEGSVKLFERNGYEKCAHFREVGRKFGKLLDNVAYQKILK